MKRFFQPVAPPAAKKAKAGDESGPAAGVGGAAAPEAERPGQLDPLSFVTWNANSLLGRLRNVEHKDAFMAYVRERDPDVIALQETWLPANTNSKAARSASNVVAAPRSSRRRDVFTLCSLRTLRRVKMNECGHPDRRVLTPPGHTTHLSQARRAEG